MATIVQPIGITLPITHGEAGYFRQSFNVVEQVKSNLNLLLRTKKGERRMNPNFGSGLWEVVFEFNDDNLGQLVESTIRRDIERWMPYVNVQQVTVKNDSTERDQNVIGISVSFTVNSAGITSPQTIDISMQQGAL